MRAAAAERGEVDGLGENIWGTAWTGRRRRRDARKASVFGGTEVGR